jgi:selenoprotein W-related protein
VSELALVPSRGGVFEVTVDERLVYSKRATGRHAEHDEVLALVRALAS